MAGSEELMKCLELMLTFTGGTAPLLYVFLCFFISLRRFRKSGVTTYLAADVSLYTLSCLGEVAVTLPWRTQISPCQDVG